MNPEVHAVAALPGTVIPSKIHVGPSHAHQASEERLKLPVRERRVGLHHGDQAPCDASPHTDHTEYDLLHQGGTNTIS
jgi:hypothetical protein